MSTAAFERVERLRELGRLADAEREARAALAADPEDPGLLSSLAAVLLSAERHAEGLGVAEAACAADPDQERAHRLRGLLASRLGRHPEAIWACWTAVTLAPEEPYAALGYATALQAAGRLADALAVARRAASLDPALAHAHLMVADISANLGRRKAARAAYAEVLRLEPDHAVARHDLAVQDFRSQRMGRALRGLIDAGELDPTMPQVLTNVAAVLWRLAWRLRIWLVVTTIVLIAGFSEGGDPLAVRLVTLAMLLVTGGLVWWTVRELPPGAVRVARAALREDRPLAFSYLAIGGCLVVYLLIVGTGDSAPAVLVVLALGMLGVLAFFVGWGRRVRR